MKINILISSINILPPLLGKILIKNVADINQYFQENYLSLIMSLWQKFRAKILNLLLYRAQLCILKQNKTKRNTRSNSIHVLPSSDASNSLLYANSSSVGIWPCVCRSLLDKLCCKLSSLYGLLASYFLLEIKLVW